MRNILGLDMPVLSVFIGEGSQSVSAGTFCKAVSSLPDCPHVPQGEAIAMNLREMFGLRVPILSVVIGEGGSGGALAIGCSNWNLIMEHSVYYVASPEACAAILWKSRDRAPTVSSRFARRCSLAAGPFWGDSCTLLQPECRGPLGVTAAPCCSPSAGLFRVTAVHGLWHRPRIRRGAQRALCAILWRSSDPRPHCQLLLAAAFLQGPRREKTFLGLPSAAKSSWRVGWQTLEACTGHPADLFHVCCE